MLEVKISKYIFYCHKYILFMEKEDQKRFVFYVVLCFMVGCIIGTSLIISHNIVNDINDTLRNNEIKKESQVSFTSPIEEVRYLQEIYSEMENKNTIDICQRIKKEDYRKACIAHYYTLKALNKKDPAECLNIKAYGEESYILGCVLYFSITTHQNKCSILPDKDKKYICNNLYNDYIGEQ